MFGVDIPSNTSPSSYEVTPHAVYASKPSWLHPSASEAALVRWLMASPSETFGVHKVGDGSPDYSLVYWNGSSELERARIIVDAPGTPGGSVQLEGSLNIFPRLSELVDFYRRPLKNTYSDLPVSLGGGGQFDSFDSVQEQMEPILQRNFTGGDTTLPSDGHPDDDRAAMVSGWKADDVAIWLDSIGLKHSIGQNLKGIQGLELLGLTANEVVSRGVKQSVADELMDRIAELTGPLAEDLGLPSARDHPPLHHPGPQFREPLPQPNRSGSFNPGAFAPGFRFGAGGSSLFDGIATSYALVESRGMVRLIDTSTGEIVHEVERRLLDGRGVSTQRRRRHHHHRRRHRDNSRGIHYYAHRHDRLDNCTDMSKQHREVASEEASSIVRGGKGLTMATQRDVVNQMLRRDHRPSLLALSDDANTGGDRVSEVVQHDSRTADVGVSADIGVDVSDEVPTGDNPDIVCISSSKLTMTSQHEMAVRFEALKRATESESADRGRTVSPTYLPQSEHSLDPQRTYTAPSPVDAPLAVVMQRRPLPPPPAQSDGSGGDVTDDLAQVVSSKTGSKQTPLLSPSPPPQSPGVIYDSHGHSAPPIFAKFPTPSPVRGVENHVGVMDGLNNRIYAMASAGPANETESPKSSWLLDPPALSPSNRSSQRSSRRGGSLRSSGSNSSFNSNQEHSFMQQMFEDRHDATGSGSLRPYQPRSRTATPRNSSHGRPSRRAATEPPILSVPSPAPAAGRAIEMNRSFRSTPTPQIFTPPPTSKVSSKGKSVVGLDTV